MLIEQLLPSRLRSRRFARPVLTPPSEAPPLENPANYELLYRLSTRWVRNSVLQGAFMLAGVFSAALGLKAFLLPNDFIDGGVTGISMLVSHVTGISLSILIVVINIPFIVLGYFQMGRPFAIKTLLTILLLALALLVVSFPPLTQDKLLIAVFGGFFLGAGIGLAMRGGAVLDGTEILAVYISRKLPGSIGDIILVINIIIFGVAAWLLSIETALYSVLAYLSAAKTVDFVVSGIEEYTGLTIISAHSEAIRQLITDKLRRGATVYECTRGFGSHGHQHMRMETIYTVVTRLEVLAITGEVHKIDPHAFIVMQSVSDIRGGLVKKRPLH
ncbi:YitT family protein [Hymenobacter fodinae]|uniref:YitT family protein n=1 Tax=Hymenobacter fodinae TaxID=2510796 RepID=A0A4Z0PA39_9BACT|nr:YitT family protein [Hymenobacter fodinae]TGE08316.1 YitT family protein [Hymenobacter fodinae]